jgi:predicted transposase YdaD
MYQAHIKKITPQEVLRMDTRLARFATTNPGFKQFETQLKQALADPDVLNTLRMETSERMRQAGMIKAAEKKGERNRDKAIALNMLGLDIPIEKIVKATGLTIEEINNLR